MQPAFCARFLGSDPGDAQHYARWIDCDDLHVQIAARGMMIDGRKDRCDFAFLSRPAAENFSPLAVIAARITTITMREDCWADMVKGVPEMAGLKDMGIVLMTCPETRDNLRSPSSEDYNNLSLVARGGADDGEVSRPGIVAFPGG